MSPRNTLAAAMLAASAPLLHAVTLKVANQGDPL